MSNDEQRDSEMSDAEMSDSEMRDADERAGHASGHSELPLDFGGLPFTGDAFTSDAVEVERFAEALNALEHDAGPRVDPREDPMLAAMLDTVARFDETLTAATDNERFRAFAARSRRTIEFAARRHAVASRETALAVRSTELAEQAAGSLAASRTLVEAPGGLFGFLRRPWVAIGVPVTAAAAAALATFAILGGGDATQTTVAVPPGATVASVIGLDEVGVPSYLEPEPPSVESFVASLTDSELSTAVDRISLTLEIMRFRIDNGEPLDAGLLRDLAQSATYVAREVEYAPPSAFAIEPLISYLLDTSAARDLLESAIVEDGQEEALATAKTAVVEGLVAASLFIARTN